jgi:hypothetical protein
MSHIYDARNRPLSSLVSTLKLDSEANSAKELGSKGYDLYVKQGKESYTSETSRANHRANAVVLVRDSLASEYNATTKDAKQILANSR